MKDTGQDVTGQPGRLETQTWSLSRRSSRSPAREMVQRAFHCPAPLNIRQHSRQNWTLNTTADSAASPALGNRTRLPLFCGQLGLSVSLFSGITSPKSDPGSVHLPHKGSYGSGPQEWEVAFTPHQTLHNGEFRQSLEQNQEPRNKPSHI